MRLIEIDEGFVLQPGDPSCDCRQLAKSLLDFLRQDGMPFLVGGAAEDDILTIGPLSPRQSASLLAWWASAAAR